MITTDPVRLAEIVDTVVYLADHSDGLAALDLRASLRGLAVLAQEAPIPTDAAPATPADRTVIR